jgi:hypothetical protein
MAAKWGRGCSRWVRGTGREIGIDGGRESELWVWGESGRPGTERQAGISDPRGPRSGEGLCEGRRGGDDQRGLRELKVRATFL